MKDRLDKKKVRVSIQYSCSMMDVGEFMIRHYHKKEYGTELDEEKYEEFEKKFNRIEKERKKLVKKIESSTHYKKILKLGTEISKLRKRFGIQ